MTERITVNIEDGIADVRMNRVDKLNALDQEQIEAHLEVGKRVSAEKAVRAVVLSANGKAFCSGLDASMFMQGTGGLDILNRDPGAPCNRAQMLAYQWAVAPMPVIAAVHGYCFGGGMQIALGADIRFVHPEAQLSIMEIKWGLIPDMSITQTLRHLLPLDVAKELTFTGRIFSGVEAKELGLATHVSEQPFEDAMTLAREIASKSPHAVRAAKLVLQDGRYGSLEEGLTREETEQRKLLASPNNMEAIMANFEKRSPKFQDPD